MFAQIKLCGKTQINNPSSKSSLYLPYSHSDGTAKIWSDLPFTSWGIQYTKSFKKALNSEQTSKIINKHLNLF